MKKEDIFNLFTFSFLLALIGLVLLFIKWQIGLLLIILFIGVSIFINTKYPNEFKQILEEAKSKEAKKVKKFLINHITGVKNADQNQQMFFEIEQQQIKFIDKKGKNLCELNFSDIKNLSILEEINITQKNKSAAARAIVGGLLLGPVGAVVGGISGLNPTLQQNKNYYLEFKTLKTSDIVINADIKALKEIKKIILGEY